jgi:hypothetical protein
MQFMQSVSIPRRELRAEAYFADGLPGPRSIPTTGRHKTFIQRGNKTREPSVFDLAWPAKAIARCPSAHCGESTLRR